MNIDSSYAWTASTLDNITGEKLENSTKLNWKITWGKIRTSKEDEED